MNKRQKERDDMRNYGCDLALKAESKVLDAIERTDDPFFRDFLKKVDGTSQSTLILELFGSEEAYIDTPGDWCEMDEADIVYYVRANSGSDGGLLRLYAWYCANWDKCWIWVHHRRTKAEVNLAFKKQFGEIKQ